MGLNLQRQWCCDFPSLLKGGDLGCQVRVNDWEIQRCDGDAAGDWSHVQCRGYCLLDANNFKFVS